MLKKVSLLVLQQFKPSSAGFAEACTFCDYIERVIWVVFLTYNRVNLSIVIYYLTEQQC